jgi:hypothetical protein
MLEQLQSLDHQVYGEYTLSKHIGETLETIAREQPADPLGAFEEMSQLLWVQRHVTPNTPAPTVPTEELDRCTAVLGLIEKLSSTAAQKVDTMFFEFREKWAEAGIDFNPDFALLLQCALVKLAEDEQITAVRFWGTFNTPAGALYVAEADIGLEFRDQDAPVVGPYDVPVEVGIGVNRFVYYVTKSPFDDWTRLPDARPSDISKSRKVFWQLTGDLSAAVQSFEPFDVTEDVYIRALVGRISSSTILAPTDYLKVWEPEEEEEAKEPPPDEEEEAKEPPPKQLRIVLNPEYEAQEIDNIEWVHVRPFILPQGRESYKKAAKPPKVKKEKKEKREKHGEEEEEEEEKNEAEEEAAEEEEETPEEGIELFGGAGEDEPIREEDPCWAQKTITSPIEGQSLQIDESVRCPGRTISRTERRRASTTGWAISSSSTGSSRRRRPRSRANIAER